MVIIYTVAGVCGISAELGGRRLLAAAAASARRARSPLGASAAIFGFLGALVYYGRRTGSHAGALPKRSGMR